MPRDQWRIPGIVKIERQGAPGPADLEDVGEPLGCDQRRFGAAALEERVDDPLLV
jgi:hypothetical protein